MQSIEIISYGIQNTYRLRGEEIDPQALVFVIYKHNAITYCYAKAGEFHDVERQVRSADRETLPGQEQVEKALTRILQNIEPLQVVNEESEKQRTLWSRFLDWLYEYDISD